MSTDAWVGKIARWIPRAFVRPAVRLALGRLHVALCLHRVSDRPVAGPQAAMTIPRHVLDELISTLLASGSPHGVPRVTVTFDDGYQEAAHYVADRASRWPMVEWLFFVCPQKVATRAGFRWDLAPSAMQEGVSPSPELENRDVALLGRADAPGVTLATVASCQALARFDNVSLGNHTNGHFRHTALALEDSEKELSTSKRDFEHLFGPQTHFAFPFGTPGQEFDARHVAQLRALGNFFIWSTERRPFREDERAPGAVLPRFPINGTWSAKQLLFWIAFRAWVFRWRGTQHRFGPIPV
ncbi:MAG: polysaccharide deacetylase family protein [Myxococcaceae bacterium]